MYSWIARSILSHDTENGANLEATHTGTFVCQITRFTNYPSPTNPRVEAVVADCTHKVDVAFDLEETVRQETSVSGEEPERLTSQLRAVISLTSFRIQLNPPSRSAPTLPRLQLLALSWQVLNGYRRDPVHFPDARRVGTTPADDKERKLLTKWWAGITSSQSSGPYSSFAPAPPAPEQPPMSRRGSTIPTAGGTDDGPIFLWDLLRKDVGSKKKDKPVPSRLNADAREAYATELDSIKVFGQVKPPTVKGEKQVPKDAPAAFGGDDQPPQAAESPANTGSLESQQSHLPSPPQSKPATAIESSPSRRGSLSASPFPDPVPLEEPPAELRRAAPSPPPPVRPPLPLRQVGDSSEPDAIPIQPLRVPGFRRNTSITRRLPIPVRSADPTESSEDEDNEDDKHYSTDEEQLSDYERKARQKEKKAREAARAPPPAQPTIEQSPKVTNATGDESFSQSQDSSQMDLARYSGVPAAAPAATERIVLVETTDESDPKDREPGLPPSTMPLPPAAQHKRARRDTDVSVASSHDADERPAKRQREAGSRPRESRVEWAAVVEERSAMPAARTADRRSNTSHPTTPSGTTEQTSPATVRLNRQSLTARATAPSGPFAKLNGWMPCLDVTGIPRSWMDTAIKDATAGRARARRRSESAAPGRS